MAKKRQSKAARKIKRTGKKIARKITKGKGKAQPTNQLSKPTSRTGANANTRTKVRRSPRGQWYWDSMGTVHPAKGTSAKSRKKAGEGKRPTVDDFK